MNNIIDLSSKELHITRQILKQHLPSNARVWVFGSRAKGNARKFSDLDLLVDTHHQPLSLSLLTQLLDDFEASDLPFKVDIVDWNTINEDFRALIHQEKIALTFVK